MDQVLLLDFDECLAHFNYRAGVKKLINLLEIRVDDKAPEIGKNFEQIYNDMDLILHGKGSKKILDVKDKLNSYDVKLPKELVGKKVDFMWSRQLWLKYLSDKYELGLNE